MAGTGKESRLDTTKQRLSLIRERVFYQSQNSPIIVISIIVFAIIIESGFLLILSEPTPLFSGEFGIVLTDPRLNDQVIMETILVSLFVGFGTIGLWMIKRAPVYVDDRDRAVFTQFSGIAMFIICFLLLYLLMVLKVFGNFNNLNVFG
jgi:hypothetical protein